MKHIDINSLKHFGVCLALVLLLGWNGAYFAAGASFTKEWCDLKYTGHWCWTDLAFDLIGILTGIILIICWY
jgi:hypothetical protein